MLARAVLALDPPRLAASSRPSASNVGTSRAVVPCPAAFARALKTDLQQSHRSSPSRHKPARSPTQRGERASWSFSCALVVKLRRSASRSWTEPVAGSRLTVETAGPPARMAVSTRVAQRRPTPRATSRPLGAPPAPPAPALTPPADGGAPARCAHEVARDSGSSSSSVSARGVQKARRRGAARGCPRRRPRRRPWRRPSGRLRHLCQRPLVQRSNCRLEALNRGRGRGRLRVVV